ncbi:isochorismatase family protein [Ferrimonas sp. SCSIO 43195]|uniref:isochorismatase family protein n=1 Tax=Ferrimonas sp. SCSIO 43195 TaxID=2822844 RepID=UPI002075192A|nr:isochorismatase family protein [Ferrimonas sp. SCSIO 43195]USD35942.1 isochorismatase family protein [Ferrimonas sp. SCSIO 43195]
MLELNQTGLVLVDVQGRLAQKVHDSEAVLARLRGLLQAMRLLNRPVLWLEQNPVGLGPTHPMLAAELLHSHPVIKHSFNGCREPAVLSALAGHDCRQWLVCGIEAHICVYQTARGMQQAGYEVEVVSDAVSSRDPANLALALARLSASKVALTSVEMALYELMQDANHEAFGAILPLVKSLP